MIHIKKNLHIIEKVQELGKTEGRMSSVHVLSHCMKSLKGFVSLWGR